MNLDDSPAQALAERPVEPVPSPRLEALGPTVALTDDELVRAHLAEDAQAFNELMRRHRVALYVVALRVLRDHEDAQDAVQTALLRAFRSAATYRGDSGVLPWLRAIVENVSRTAARTRDHNGREVVGLPAEGDNLAATEAGPEHTTVRFAEARELLSRLGEPYRTTFVLVKLQGFTYAEAAVIEHVSVGTIRSRVWRAKAILQGHTGGS
jgi:RNA polymerase sigma-70 factor (ECF subfamily)